MRTFSARSSSSVSLLFGHDTLHESMNTNPKVRYPHFVFWAMLLAFVIFLLFWQSTSDIRLISLPGLFLSLGMLCLLSRGFCPTKYWLCRFLYAVALVLFALSLIVSARFFLSR